MRSPAKLFCWYSRPTYNTFEQESIFFLLQLNFAVWDISSAAVLIDIKNSILASNFQENWHLSLVFCSLGSELGFQLIRDSKVVNLVHKTRRWWPELLNWFNIYEIYSFACSTFCFPLNRILAFSTLRESDNSWFLAQNASSEMNSASLAQVLSNRLLFLFHYSYVLNII